MSRQASVPTTHVTPEIELEAAEWMAFPGGELEAPRPEAPGTLCDTCRERRRRGMVPVRTLCFQCYRAGQARDRAITAAGKLDTATEARFQCTLPFEPVNRLRLEHLRAERTASRNDARTGLGRYVDQRRHAQIAARHALQWIVAGLQARADKDRALAAAAHAAELQLPEAWLPFVVSQ